MANHSEHRLCRARHTGQIYVGIWAILMFLTASTVMRPPLELGVFNIVLALLIATIKGTSGRALLYAPALQHQAHHGRP